MIFIRGAKGSPMNFLRGAKRTCMKFVRGAKRMSRSTYYVELSCLLRGAKTLLRGAKRHLTRR